MKNKIVLFLTLLFATVACNQAEFAAPTIKQNQNASTIQNYNYSYCSNFSLIKPPVDFLFLWDNSSSQTFVNTQTKQALNEMLLNVSQNFNYRIVLAPLIPVGTSNPMHVITSDSTGMSDSAKSLIIGEGEAISRLQSFPLGSGNNEAGVQRAYSVISDNVSNGIFRGYGNTIIVIMSNGDDRSYYGSNTSLRQWGQSALCASTTIYSKACRDEYLQKMESQFSQLNTSTLHASQLRFLTMVAHSACTLSTENVASSPGNTYKEISRRVYVNSGSTDQSFRSDKPDSYDICTADFKHLFDGINMVIQPRLVEHVYNYWPIGNNPPAFDPQRITVKKIVNNSVTRELQENDANGFEYVGYMTAQNTRRLPTAGEPFTGHLIRLLGSGEVTYPECLQIETQSPAAYYGYIQLHTEPVVSSIRLQINDREFTQSTTNGWSYIGFKATQNVKVQDRTHSDQPGLPAENKTGYFIKLHGDAIYTNGARINLSYQGTGG